MALSRMRFIGRLLCLAGLLVLVYISRSAGAQGLSPAYWRYDAPGRLNNISVADLNHDGIDEFIIVAGDNNVIPVSSDGRALWPNPFQSQEAVLRALPLPASDQQASHDDIVVASLSHLSLLGQNGEQLWQRPLRDTPAAMVSFAPEPGGETEILLALESGGLQRFNRLGQVTWQLRLEDMAVEDAAPMIALADLHKDGQVEIIYSYLSMEGFGKLLVLDATGRRRWERSSSGRTTELAVVDFAPEEPLEIAVGTELDRVYLYTAEGHRRWPYRTPNKPITNLSFAILDDAPALVVGTAAGTLIAYDSDGRRYWSGAYHVSDDRPVLAVSGTTSEPSGSSPVALALVLGHEPDSQQPADVLLLDGSGRRLEPSYVTADTSGLTRLVDVNHDGSSELLLAGFATMELLDPGIGAREYSEAWTYRLAAEPQSVLVADVELDGENELLIGTNDGRLHALKSDGSPFWVRELGGAISELTIAESGSDSLPALVVGHNDRTLDPEGLEYLEGWIEVLRPDGRPVWTSPLPSTISALLVTDINSSLPPEILVGMTDGQILAFSLTGDEFWRTSVNGSVNHLLSLIGSRGSELFVGSQANAIDRFNNKGRGNTRIAEFLRGIHSLLTIERPDLPMPQLLAIVEDGTARALNSRGVQLWEVAMNGVPSVTLSAGNFALVGTDEGELIRLDTDGSILWQIQDLGHITSLFWGDLDGDVRPDIALGNRSGEVMLMTADGKNTWGRLELASEVFQVVAIQQPAGLQADLVAVTDNGVVQLFRAQANRPPLLINPLTEVGEGSYNISVSVIDVEQNPVTVDLEIYFPESDRWISQGNRTASSGNGTLLWPVEPPEDASQLNYRFSYDDGAHQGQVQPAVGPRPISPTPVLPDLMVVAIVALTGVSVAALYARHSRAPAPRARRFYQRLKQRPDETLGLLEQAFVETAGSPDFFLSLSSSVRREPNRALASLTDGLYLLAVRPEAAPAIIESALDEASGLDLGWRALDEWKDSYATVSELLSVPSVTELSLLRPRLQKLLDRMGALGPKTEPLGALLPVLSTLGDSGIVDLAEDRLVYLQEAIGILRQIGHHLEQWPVLMETKMAEALVTRWLGLVMAEIEDLRGRAQLILNLKTKRLVPAETTIVALEMRNVGRAPAEQIVITAESDTSFRVLSPAQAIPFLPPGRSRQVQFTIAPPDMARFRLVFQVTYADRQSDSKQIAFADQVHLLPRRREYSPIPNPYSPGTPLRRNSVVFYGREDLFDFIRVNAGRLSQRNVLVLVGQRRTGKTSALLQLDRHLPDSFLPVYVDCQSLGVVPGMQAFFHDLAWAIADALASRGMELVVPHPDKWHDNPAWHFQRHFIAKARALLPSEATILLVFDEFEALQNLVNDGYLPSTLFTYLRHLMQHGQGLGFIFAGTHRLEAMGTDYWSVLFNIALYRHVGYLSEDAAIRVISEPVAPNIIYDDLAIDKILRVTAGHPYFLQLVCYSLVNRANAEQLGYITISDVNAALEEMLRLGEVHFAYLWQRSNSTEQALLAAAAQLMDRQLVFRPADLVNYLAQYGIRIDLSRITAGLNRLVQREILREIADEGMSLYEIKIGLVGLWVAQNKSLSRLHQTLAPLVPAQKPIVEGLSER